MIETRNTRQPIVTDATFNAAQEVIQTVRQTTTYPFLLDAKLGDANNGPMPDTKIASTYNTALNSIRDKFTRIINALAQTDQKHGTPLAQIAQRANDIMASAAIVNRHKRRPPLYAESTLNTFVKLGFAAQEHFPLMRAAGYVTPPTITPPSHDVDFIIADIAAHVARSHEPQSPDQILESMGDRQGDLANWPQLDLPLFIRRVAGIHPDDRGLYHPDQPWGSFLSGQRLVASTMLRIFARDQQPRTTAYLINEIERLVGRFLPSGYNTINAVRNFAYTSEEVSWQGRSKFGLREWETGLDARNTGNRRGRTGDHIYAFLTQQGPTKIDDVIEYGQRTTRTTKRTIEDALNHDLEDRFIQIPDQRVAANPIPRGHNPGAPSLVVVPDTHHHQPQPVLHEAEFLWLTRYVQAINDLTPPLPERVALTGRRAAGFAQGDPIEITVVVDTRHRPSLEPRLAKIAATSSRLVPSMQPHISILSPQQWEHQQESDAPEAHHNAWLATNTAP